MDNKPQFEFGSDVSAMAQFVAVLIVEEIVFTVKQDDNVGFVITLTGGH
jgi:hypothetical protein